jgi:hypothetical protein
MSASSVQSPSHLARDDLAGYSFLRKDHLLERSKGPEHESRHEDEAQQIELYTGSSNWAAAVATD